jgi:O-methyltransferase
MSLVRSVAERGAALAGLRISPAGKNGFPPDFSDEDAREIRAVRPFTLTNPERIHALIQATRYIVDAGVPGDIVECGVWKGGSMMTIARALSSRNDRSRNLYLFDTFQGMTEATAEDLDYKGRDASRMLANSKGLLALEDITAYAPLEEVKRNMASTGYPAELIHYKVGRVEDTLPAQAPQQIALLRLDTDWDESTRHEMEHLFPRLSRGGVLIIDDYGHWQGSRKAVDEYLEATGLKVLLNRIDYNARLVIKP